MIKYSTREVFITIITVLVVTSGVIFAGDLDNASDPEATFVTLSDLYEKLTDNTYATSSHSPTPEDPPASTGYTLEEIYNLIPTLDPDTIVEGETIMGVEGTAETGGSDLEWSDDQGNSLWDAAASACDSLTDGGGGWRLPSIGELFKGIADQILGNPPPSPANGFVTGSYYWAEEKDAGNAYALIHSGSVISNVSEVDKTAYSYKTRCVR